MKKKDDLENFYDQIDNSKVLFNKFIEQCSLISDTISGQYLQIYVNYGNGYFEENSYKFLYGDEIKLNLSGRYVEYILLKFREIDSVFIEKSYYINKNNEIEELMKSDSPNSYRNFQNMLLIDELKFMEYKINNEVMEVNICIRDYKVLGKNELFEKLYNLEKKLVILDKRNNQLIGEKEELVKQNSVLIKENKDLIDEKNRTLKARILRKISLIKSKIK